MKKLLIAVSVTLAPAIALAQTQLSTLNNVNDVGKRLTQIGNLVIELLIAFAVIWIIISIIRFIMASGEERAAHRSSILWGIVGLAVILSIWGLVAILTNTFSVSTPSVPAPTNPIPPPVY